MDKYELLQGDVMDVLRTLPSESVQVCVTSPPYWNLRDYGIEGQIGLEPTLDAYVQKMVEVFREVRRVLRSDGTLWLNIGDSYIGNATGSAGKSSRLEGGKTTQEVASRRPDKFNDGLKPKDLCMVPARVALALQADVWYLRSEIIWAKKAPMPESVTDRPTCAHEKIFLLSKSAKYYYDADAVKERLKPESILRNQSGWNGNEERDYTNGKQNHMSKYLGSDKAKEANTANLRNVWHLSPDPYAAAHFATFPTIIPKRAILAGTSEKGCCPCCGAGWVRVTETEIETSKTCPKTQAAHEARGGHGKPVGTVGKSGSGRIDPVRREIGWQPSCTCGIEETVPAVVLDPFAGSGTTLAVALSLGRHAIGIEINPEYIKLAEERIAPHAAQSIMAF